MLTRVLLAEDEPLIRLVTADHLKRAGFSVTETSEGSHAIRLLNECEPFELLFTDIRLADSVGGFAVAKYARKLYPTIPILIVSGYAQNLAVQLRHFSSPVVFVGKPYDLELIVQTIRRLIATA